MVLLRARVQVEQLRLHGLARLRVERAERLVHQQHLGIDRERARDADALLHAAGELVRAAIERIREPDELEIARRGVAQLGAAHALHLEAEHHVLQRGQPGQQLGELKHHAAIVAAALHLAAVDRDLAADAVSSPMAMRSAVVLPQPEGPMSETISPSLHGEAHAAERLHGLQRAVDAQREPFRYVEQGHLTHAASYRDPVSSPIRLGRPRA